MTTWVMRTDQYRAVVVWYLRAVLAKRYYVAFEFSRGNGIRSLLRGRRLVFADFRRIAVNIDLRCRCIVVPHDEGEVLCI